MNGFQPSVMGGKNSKKITKGKGAKARGFVKGTGKTKTHKK